MIRKNNDGSVSIQFENGCLLRLKFPVKDDDRTVTVIVEVEARDGILASSTTPSNLGYFTADELIEFLYGEMIR